MVQIQGPKISNDGEDVKQQEFSFMAGRDAKW
jgi:hypothetical protein